MKQKKLGLQQKSGGGEIAGLLLDWFDKNKRDLPWRKTRDPYRIWISEVMLQQTQVGTVIPYYKRWLKSFPRVQALARAPLSRILKLWEGLGYYSRARNLHKTAKIVTKNWGGRFPSSKETLQRLPGIGRYTAGAIASIVFGKPEPILDGNVKRVLSRILALKEPLDKARGEKILWEASKRLVEAGMPRAGDLNQSLMELGSLICLPENPNCSYCPVKKVCEAHRLGLEEEFPIKSKKERTRELKALALILWKGSRVLLQKQPLQGRWGGLWTFPQWIQTNGEPEKKLIRKRAEKNLGVRLDGIKKRMEVRYGFTNYRVRLGVYEAKAISEKIRHVWIPPDRLIRFALPSPHRKIAREIQSHA